MFTTSMARAVTRK